MPSVVCESAKSRSPSVVPAVQSPPRKRFKFSLKLKQKKKGHGKMSRKEKSKHEHEQEIEDCEENGKTEISEDNTANGISGSDTSVVPEINAAIPPLPFAGLANLGNTCYVNAVLQVLRYCPKFIKTLENLDEISCQEDTTRTTPTMNDESSVSVDDVTVLSKPSIINSIQKLAHEMANAEVNYDKFGMEAEEVKNRSGCTTLAVYPREFVKDFSGVRPMFGGYEQHDAQEFLRSLLSLVEEDCIGLDKGLDTQKDNSMKENIQLNTRGSKVKGGSKYPPKLPGDVNIETVAESTSMTLTSECRINNDNCSEDQNNTRKPGANKTFMPKCFDKDFNCLKCATSNDMNMVKRLFEGTLLLQTRCLDCESVRHRYEKFQDISVPVQNTKQEQSNIEDKVINVVSDSEDESERDVNLSWAISKFASVERLQGENKYFCDSCATLTEAEISSYFEKLPQVLTIHLKRFQTCYGQSNFLSSWITKVTKSLHTPQLLSLDKWCSKTCCERSAVYKLFGVVMHSGMGSCSGHYLSYVNVHLLNEQSGLMWDTRETKCSCQDRNPEQPDDGEKTDDVKENVQQSGLNDSLSMKSRDTGIAKYFQVLKKSKASTGSQKSTSSLENLSCKEDTCSSSNITRCATGMSMSSVNELSQPQESKMDHELTDDASVPDMSTEIHCDTTGNKDSSSSEAKWLKFDDAEVQEMSKKEIDEILSPSSSCYSTPYLLFYFRS